MHCSLLKCANDSLLKQVSRILVIMTFDEPHYLRFLTNDVNAIWYLIKL